MKPMSYRYKRLIETLESLVESEHMCGCDQSTCDIKAAWDHGSSLWAIQLFRWSGAGSDEFYNLVKKLPKRFENDAEIERRVFVEEVEYAECPHCNAVVWDPQWVTNAGMIFCNSCAREFPEVKGA